MEALFPISGTRVFWTVGELYKIVDAMPTPVSWASVSDGRIGFVNRAFTELFGYTMKDLTTIDDWVEHFLRTDDRERARASWEGPLRGARSGISIIPPQEQIVRCRNGSVITVQHRGTLLHDLDIAVAVFEDISLQKQAETALLRIAFEDALTGIPNRRGLQNEWHRIMKRPSHAMGGYSLLLADLDGFKAVNDRWGHDIGDGVLIEATRRLRAAMGQDGVLCRLGGDEFVIFLADRTGARGERLARRVQTAFARPVQTKEGDAPLGVSIGASRFPTHGTDLRGLLRYADEALYQVKRQGKGRFAWFGAGAPAPLEEPQLRQHPPVRS